MIGILLVILMFGLTGCLIEEPRPLPTQQKDQIINEQAQQTLVNNQPTPIVTKSLERENIIKRVNLINDQSKVFYVYLISYGKVMAFYTAQGKVSSLNSYLTAMETITRDEKCARDYNGDGGRSGCYFATQAPDVDGTYGSNADGVFFFTTEGVYVEWKGEYMVSDQPLKLSNNPELVKQVN